MTNPFSKKQVPIKTQEELDKRARNVLYLTEIQGAHPQIRITSMCDQCTVASLNNPITNEGIRYDKRVNNTLRSRQELAKEGVGIGAPLYDPTTYSPYPIVTEVKVTKQGELGTTRKTTISIIAYDDDQLLELQKCLFIPGMSVRVEWGFYMPEIPAKDTETDNTVNSIILQETKKNPNYEGLQGLVTNFNYSLTQGQYWNCSVEVISAAEALIGGSTETPCVDSTTNPPSLGSKCVQEVKSDENKKASEHRSLLYNYLFQLASTKNRTSTRGKMRAEYRDQYGLQAFTGIENLKNVTRALGGNPEDVSFEVHQYTGDVRDASGGSGGLLGALGSLFTFNMGAGTDEVYMTWAAFEAAVNLYSFPFDPKEKSFTNGCLDSSRVVLSYHRLLESTDPRVCIIPGTQLARYLLDNDNQNSLEGIPSAIVKEGDKGGVMLSRIRLNVIMLIKHLNAVEDAKTGDFKVKTFITNVLNEINSVCGDLWEFEVITNNEDENFKYPKLSVVDIKFPGIGNQKVQVYDFPGKILTQNDKETRRSILRDMSFNMKMTSAMKTQALYSGNYKSTKELPTAVSTDPKNPCQAASLRPFKIGVLVNSKFYTNLARKPLVYAECEPCKSPDQVKKTFKETMQELQSKGVTDESTNQAASLLRQEYADSVYKGDDQHCAGQPLPFELSLTIDGIGGFGFGQLITCNRIPENIRDTYDWQVTSVEHTINPSGWVTQINTIPRMKPQPIKERPVEVINAASSLLGVTSFVSVTAQSNNQNPIATTPPTTNSIPNTGGILFDQNGKPITLP